MVQASKLDILKKEINISLQPDYNKKCPVDGTRMVVCKIPGTSDEDGSWMYNCLYVECPYHDPAADQPYVSNLN